MFLFSGFHFSFLLNQSGSVLTVPSRTTRVPQGLRLRDKKAFLHDTSQVKQDTTSPLFVCFKQKASTEKSCYNCASKRFGWKDDTSWDSCDYVCQIGPIGTLLFCIHEMTLEEVTAKLRTLSCDKWTMNTSPKESSK